MSKLTINAEECTGCGICVDSCPNEVLDLEDDQAIAVNEDECTACGTCAEECPMGCVEVEVDEE